MTLQRAVIASVILGAALYAIAVSVAFRPTPLSAEEQRLVGAWAVTGKDEVLHFGEDRSFSQEDTDLGRWSLEGGALKLHYRGTSNRFWIPASMRGFDFTVAIEFDDVKGIATISDSTAVAPHPVWVRQTKK
jgi:hypothetical protein